MHLKVPFYSNTPDDTPCFQATLRMVMKYYWPEKEYSWEELDKVTAKVNGMGTWPFAGNIWLAENGMEVKVIQMFDNQRFVDEGVEYIKEFAGEQVARWQQSHSDISQECVLAKESIKKIPQETRTPTIEDIKKYLDGGWIPTCNVNSWVLDGKEGYAGHKIAIIGYDDAGLYLHNPGLPPRENQHVSYKAFEKAWAYPTKQIKNLTLYRAK